MDMRGEDADDKQVTFLDHPLHFGVAISCLMSRGGLFFDLVTKGSLTFCDFMYFSYEMTS